MLSVGSGDGSYRIPETSEIGDKAPMAFAPQTV